MGALTDQRKSFHAEVFRDVLRVDDKGIPSNADKDNPASVAFAKGIIQRIGTAVTGMRLPGQSSGSKFEDKVHKFLQDCFPLVRHLRPGSWHIERISTRNRLTVANYAQYAHLKTLADLIQKHPELAASVGNDYSITPDIIIAREPEEDATINAGQILVDSDSANAADLRKKSNQLPLLHASVSCKWSLRSDRAQNVRAEALNLIRNRKGRLPHVVAVTAEPLPIRLASLALGTGDIDCVYHFALPELVEATEASNYPDSQEAIATLISGRRLKDISDLPLDLAV